MIERSRVRIPAGAAGECSFPGPTYRADSYIGIRSITVLPRSTQKIPVILPKVQEAGYSYIRMNLAYVALHELTCCMIVWCTQNPPTWHQFHVAQAMPTL